MKTDERHIIERILKGETRLFEYFLEKYSQQVFILMLRIIENREDAEELTQDVFVKAFGHLSSFKADSTFSTWIYRIAYNTAITAARKKKQSQIVVDDALIANLSDVQVDDVLDNEQAEQIEKLHRAIGLLSADERALITLHYEEDKPLSEAALILGLTESNAKVKLHRIRKKLYVLITKDEI